MRKTGRCLCGAVRFTADVSAEASACHCDMCRRWAGSLAMMATADGLAWEGAEHVKVFRSSAWAERGFCAECGSSLFYRITAPGPHQGRVNLALGLMDDPSGFELVREWYIDKKPETYALVGERERVTAAQVEAMFGGEAAEKEKK